MNLGTFANDNHVFIGSGADRHCSETDMDKEFAVH